MSNVNLLLQWTIKKCRFNGPSDSLEKLVVLPVGNIKSENASKRANWSNMILQNLYFFLRHNLFATSRSAKAGVLFELAMVGFPRTCYNGMISGPSESSKKAQGGDTGLGDERSMTEVSVKEQMKKLVGLDMDKWIQLRMSFSSSRTPGLDPVPSLEALETTVDSSGTPSMLLVLSFEPLVLGYLLLIFLLSLRAFIMLAASCSTGVRV
ncbi:hypothetical protein Tco_0407056 [Tanacetum coccineum]